MFGNDWACLKVKLSASAGPQRRQQYEILHTYLSHPEALNVRNSLSPSNKHFGIYSPHVLERTHFILGEGRLDENYF